MFFKISIPIIKTSPEVGNISPEIILKVVVFPAPFIPNNVKHSPFLIPKLTKSTASLGLLFYVIKTFLNLLTKIE
jgi:hypothetical protein